MRTEFVLPLMASEPGWVPLSKVGNIALSSDRMVYSSSDETHQLAQLCELDPTIVLARGAELPTRHM